MTYDQWKTDSGYVERTPEQENAGRDCSDTFCQYAADVSMPEYRCSGGCQYQSRRCDKNFVGGVGECIACDAAQGEHCRLSKATQS